MNVKLWVLVTGGGELPLFWNSRARKNLNFSERFEASMVV
jgi:hypothetical protein